MKKLPIKILVCCFVFTLMTSSVFAANEYTLYKADYKIVVGQNEYKNNNLPVLNYQGNTYVPLSEISKLLKTNVNWNAELSRVEIGGQAPNYTVPEIKPSNGKYFMGREIADLIKKKHPNKKVQFEYDVDGNGFINIDGSDIELGMYKDIDNRSKYDITIIIEKGILNESDIK